MMLTSAENTELSKPLSFKPGPYRVTKNTGKQTPNLAVTKNQTYGNKTIYLEVTFTWKRSANIASNTSPAARKQSVQMFTPLPCWFFQLYFSSFFLQHKVIIVTCETSNEEKVFNLRVSELCLGTNNQSGVLSVGMRYSTELVSCRAVGGWINAVRQKSETLSDR